jgi:hypothetical protein
MPYKPLEPKIVADSTMLWRLVAKLLLKAMVPLILVAGVFSYGVYMRGGDPSVMWKSVAVSGVDRVAGIFSGVQDDASRAVDALSSNASADATAGKLERSEVYTWQDADGVTHYSTSVPSSVTAQTVIVDPNVNVLAPVKAPLIVQTEQERFGSNRSAARTGDATDTRRGGSGQGMDTSQLIHMLQSTGN